MSKHYVIKDKGGRFIREGDFTEPEMRMVVKAGYRVFEDRDNEITPQLSGLFGDSGEDTNEFQ